MKDLIKESLDRLPELQTMLLDHLFYLTVFPIFLATCISLPLAICVRHHPLLRSTALGFSGIIQTVPSLAMLAFLLPLCGIGKTSAIVALTLYAILPMLQNTITGLRELPASVLEAADGMGFSSMQRLFLVEIPLAFPIIIGGLRTATTICVGVATLSTFIGAGGLGDLINRGLSLNRMPLILLGAGTAACLALVLDYLIEWVGLECRAGKRPSGLPFRRGVCLLLCLGLLTGATWPLNKADTSLSTTTHTGSIRIGSKNFTEQLILGELLAQWIERETSLKVERIFNLGGTVVCHNALINGEIDMYVEYTGTSLMTILNERLESGSNRNNVLQRIRKEYSDRFRCEVLSPLGFDNTYALAVRSTDATSKSWNTISDITSDKTDLRGGFTAEFMERPDGLPGLIESYGLQFASLHDLGAEMMYQALAEGEVDVVSAFSTDGRMEEFDLVPLKDDRHYFPPYQAIPVVRQSILQEHPVLRESLQMLQNKISNPQMIRLNHEVQVLKEEPVSTVTQFINRIKTTQQK